MPESTNVCFISCCLLVFTHIASDPHPLTQLLPVSQTVLADEEAQVTTPSTHENKSSATNGSAAAAASTANGSAAEGNAPAAPAVDPNLPKYRYVVVL